MNDLSHIRARYMRDPIPVRLGGLAADMARIASFSRNPANSPAVASLMREAAHFVEWCAPECDLETQAMLLELQRGLVVWRAHLAERVADTSWRAELASNAQAWSERVLALTGLTVDDSDVEGLCAALCRARAQAAASRLQQVAAERVTLSGADIEAEIARARRERKP